MTPQICAERSAQAMWATDAASKWFGFTLDEVGPGWAKMSITLSDDQLNGHGMAHGGVIFSLADSAFAFACNSHNRLAVAQHNSITYLSPGKQGETLVAEAREVSLSGRSGITDVTVTGEDGRKVALFRGASRIIDGTHFEEEKA